MSATSGVHQNPYSTNAITVAEIKQTLDAKLEFNFGAVAGFAAGCALAFSFPAASLVVKVGTIVMMTATGFFLDPQVNFNKHETTTRTLTSIPSTEDGVPVRTYYSSNETFNTAANNAFSYLKKHV